MDRDFEQTLADRAHFLAGRSPLLRNDADPSIKQSLDNATAFLGQVHSRLPSPRITGGTTSSPDDVLVLYWLIDDIGKIAGVYVTFRRDGSTEVRWNPEPNKSDAITGLTFKELIAFDVPSKFEALRRHYINQLPRYKR